MLRYHIHREIYKGYVIVVSLEESRCVHEAKHTKKVLEQELNQKKLMQERQQAFQEAFEDDLKTYKQTGSIPSKKNSLSNLFQFMLI